MTDTNKYYVTTMTVRVLAEDAPWDGGLRWLSHDVTEGEYVGDVLAEETHEVSAKEIAEMLVAAGSEPGFFGIEEEEED